jgi:hypothetical protein
MASDRQEDFAGQTGRPHFPFERIKRVNDAGIEYWSSRDFAGVLGYTDCRNFEQGVRKALPKE